MSMHKIVSIAILVALGVAALFLQSCTWQGAAG